LRTSSGRVCAIACATKPTQREAEKVDLREAEGLDEGNRVARHVGDARRGLAARAAHAAIVEDNDVALAGDAVEKPGVPVVEHGRQVVQEDHRHAAALAELTIDQPGVLHLDAVGGGVLERLGHGRAFLWGVLWGVDLDNDRYITVVMPFTMRDQRRFSKGHDEISAGEEGQDARCCAEGGDA
jgi:hypothetical protein